MLGLFEAMFTEMTADSAPDLYDPAATESLAEAIVRHLPPDSPVRSGLADPGADQRCGLRSCWPMTWPCCDSFSLVEEER